MPKFNVKWEVTDIEADSFEEAARIVSNMKPEVFHVWNVDVMNRQTVLAAKDKLTTEERDELSQTHEDSFKTVKLQIQNTRSRDGYNSETEIVEYSELTEGRWINTTTDRDSAEKALLNSSNPACFSDPDTLVILARNLKMDSRDKRILSLRLDKSEKEIFREESHE